VLQKASGMHKFRKLFCGFRTHIYTISGFFDPVNMEIWRETGKRNCKMCWKVWKINGIAKLFLRNSGGKPGGFSFRIHRDFSAEPAKSFRKTKSKKKLFCSGKKKQNKVHENQYSFVLESLKTTGKTRKVIDTFWNG